MKRDKCQSIPVAMETQCVFRCRCEGLVGYGKVSVGVMLKNGRRFSFVMEACPCPTSFAQKVADFCAASTVCLFYGLQYAEFLIATPCTKIDKDASSCKVLIWAEAKNAVASNVTLEKPTSRPSKNSNRFLAFLGEKAACRWWHHRRAR